MLNIQIKDQLVVGDSLLNVDYIVCMGSIFCLRFPMQYLVSLLGLHLF